MSRRFGRRMADGSYEYYDSKEALIDAADRESSRARAKMFGLAGLFAGGVLTHVLLLKSGVDWPKWLRFSLVIAGSGTLSYVLTILADLIWSIIMIVWLVVVVLGVGALIWKAI